MTVELTPAVVVSLLGFVALQVVQIILVARWSARIQAMVENDHVEIASLRVSRHEHGNRLAGLAASLGILREAVDTLRGSRNLDREQAP